MRILALPVEDSIADGYNNAPQQEKAQINSVINIMLEKILKKQQNAAFLNTIDELSADSAQNSLTVEKLTELMGWDEITVKNLFGEASHQSNA